MAINRKSEVEPDEGAVYFAEWVKEVGGPESAGPLLGYRPNSIRHWMNGVRQISPERAVELEYATAGRLNRVALIFGPSFLNSLINS